MAVSLSLQQDPGSFAKVGATMVASFTPPASTSAGTWTWAITKSALPLQLRDAEDALDRAQVIGMAMVVEYRLNT